TAAWSQRRGCTSSACPSCADANRRSSTGLAMMRRISPPTWARPSLAQPLERNHDAHAPRLRAAPRRRDPRRALPRRPPGPALRRARSGAKVLVVDRQAYGSDALSTHALMRGAVLQLTRWGLIPDITAARTPAIRSVTFHYGSETIRVPIKSEHGADCLFAPRRTVLDRL